MAPDGLDADPGTEQSPWATVNQVNQADLQSGDCVWFERGGVWTGTLVPSGSGTEQTPIVFGAYGTGDRPVIAGVEGKHKDGIVYRDLHLKGNAEILLGLYDVEHVVVEGCEVEGASRINVFCGPANDVTFRNCEIHHAVSEHGIYLSGEAGESYGSGEGCDDILIEDCDIHSNNAYGIQMNANGTTESAYVENYVFRRNRIAYNGYGAINDIGSQVGLVHHNFMYRNHSSQIDVGQSSGASEAIPSRNNRYYNNTIYGPGAAWGYPVAVGGSGAGNTGIEFVNNIIVGGVMSMLPAADPHDNFFDHNLYQVDGYEVGGAAYDFGGWQAQTGWDSSSFEASPGFVNAQDDDFALGSGSPAIDQGTDVGLPYSGAAPDIGADEPN